jgi:hypothetical protein
VDKLNRLARTGDSAVNAFTNQGAETRSSREGLEVGSIDDLAAGLTEVTMTRSRAIKLAGAALAGSALTLFWAGEADARNRKRRRRRRRRKAQVTPNPVPALIPGVLTLNVTNPGDELLTIDRIQLLDSDGEVIAVKELVDGPVKIAAEDTELVTVALDVDDPLVDARGIRLIDGRGVPITVVDENGIKVGDIDVL